MVTIFYNTKKEFYNFLVLFMVFAKLTKIKLIALNFNLKLQLQTWINKSGILILKVTFFII